MTRMLTAVREKVVIGTAFSSKVTSVLSNEFRLDYNVPRCHLTNLEVAIVYFSWRIVKFRNYGWPGLLLKIKCA